MEKLILGFYVATGQSIVGPYDPETRGLFALCKGSFRMWSMLKPRHHKFQACFQGDTWRGLTLWFKRLQIHISFVNPASIHSAKAVSTEKA
jgi:hypothetical protein